METQVIYHEIDDFFDIKKVANKRKNRKQKRQEQQQTKTKFDLTSVVPKTLNQQKSFNYYKEYDQVIFNGIAGVGKTFLALYLSLDSVLVKHDYEKIILIRSVVSSRDIGFLPGNSNEKSKVYESPYPPICYDLLGRQDSYDQLKKNNILQFENSSFLRGLTFKNSVIVVDEAQNMTFQELDTIITRIGENCKLVICGDINQNDLIKQQTGYSQILDILTKIESVGIIEFGIKDIVRSGFVKNYLIQKYK